MVFDRRSRDGDSDCASSVLCAVCRFRERILSCSRNFVGVDSVCLCWNSDLEESIQTQNNENNETNLVDSAIGDCGDGAGDCHREKRGPREIIIAKRRKRKSKRFVAVESDHYSDGI